MYINPDFTDKLTIKDLQKLAQYNKLANLKNESRDTRPLISLLVQLPKIDRTLFSCISYRNLAVSSYNYTLKFPDEYKPSAEEQKYLDDLNYRWKRTNLDVLRSAIVRQRLIGMGAIDFTWNTGGSLGHYIEKKKIINAVDIDYDLDNIGNLIHVDTDTKTQAVTKSNFNPSTTMLIFDNPLLGYDEDFPGGLLRINAVPIMLKYWDMYTWARKNEQTLLWAEYEKEFEHRLGEILKNLQHVASDSYAAFPKGVEIKILDAIKEGTLKSHQELVELINREIRLSILMQYSASDPQKGQSSYAQSKVGYDVAEEVIYDDLTFIENRINDYVLAHDFILNMGEPRNAFPVIEHKRLYIHDRIGQASIVTDYIAQGIPVHKKNVYDDLNLIRPDDADDSDIIKAPEPGV